MITVISILLQKNLIIQCQKTLLQDQHKEIQQTKIVYLLFQRKHSDGKLKNLNNKLTSNKTEHAELEKKITDLTNKVEQISEKG